MLHNFNEWELVNSVPSFNTSFCLRYDGHTHSQPGPHSIQWRLWDADLSCVDRVLLLRYVLSRSSDKDRPGTAQSGAREIRCSVQEEPAVLRLRCRFQREGALH